MFLNLLGNIFASREANSMFPGVGKLGNIDRKQNVPATMFAQGLRKLAHIEYYIIPHYIQVV